MAARLMMRMFDRERRARLLVILLVLASLVVISVTFRAKDGHSPLDSVGRVALTVLGPVQRGMVTIFRPVGDFFAGFTQVPSLRSRIATLERDNAELRLQQEQVQDTFRENANLRRLLALRNRYDFATVSARVIGVGPTNFGRSVYIDKGSADGIRKDMPVIGENGLVGRIVRVARSESIVRMVVDRDSAVAARLASSGEQGIVEGTGSGLHLTLLDPAAKVATGERVLTSGYSRGLFPPGIPIGTVTDAPPAGSNTTRVVTVEPFVDFSSLDYLLLVTGVRAR